MRTNIVIDDELLESARKATGIQTKRTLVEEGLRTLIRLRRQEKVRSWRGRLQWEGDLDEMRSDRK